MRAVSREIEFPSILDLSDEDRIPFLAEIRARRLLKGPERSASGRPKRAKVPSLFRLLSHADLAALLGVTPEEIPAILAADSEENPTEEDPDTGEEPEDGD